MLQRMVLSVQQDSKIREVRQQTVAVCVEKYAKQLVLAVLEKPQWKPNNNKIPTCNTTILFPSNSTSQLL